MPTPTLTNLIPHLYIAMDAVSRELTGFIPACTLDARAARAAVGQSVTSPVAPAAAAEDISPSTNPPDTGDQTIGTKSMTISKARAVPFRWDGEQEIGANHGPGRMTIQQDQIAQAMRTLVNEVEADLGIAFYQGASRAFGTAGTTPFGGKVIDDLADVKKILKDNGCPMSDLQCVLDTTAGTAFSKITNLYKANEAADTAFLRQGIFGNVNGFDIRESAGVASHTKGTGAGYLVNNGAGYAVGDYAIAADTGAGTILAGDVVTFNGDTNKYVVGTALSGGSLSLNLPGLRETLADDTAITVGNSYSANAVFHRSALVLATRAPAVPSEGDQATDAIMITDPRTGLTFEIRMYLQYRRVRYEVCLAWGVSNHKSEHSAILLG